MTFKSPGFGGGELLRGFLVCRPNPKKVKNVRKYDGGTEKAEFIRKQNLWLPDCLSILSEVAPLHSFFCFARFISFNFALRYLYDTHVYVGEYRRDRLIEWKWEFYVGEKKKLKILYRKKVHQFLFIANNTKGIVCVGLWKT